MAFDDWPLWKRALTLNMVGVVGVAIGFASSDVKLSPKFCVPIAVFSLALLNFLFLSVRPQMLAAKAVGQPGTFLQVFVRVVRERPLMLLLLMNQLVGVSQLLTVVTTLIQLLVGGRIHGLPNASTVNLRMIPVSAFVMTAVAAIWLISAIGLWRGRSWAWWLAMFLNGLAVVVSVGVELLALLVVKQHRFSFGWREITATAACILLLLPVVRNDVRRVRRDVACT